MVHLMDHADFEWAAELMERRRAMYEQFSPVFWNPAAGVRDMHASFMRSQVDEGTVVALRSERGFLLASLRDDHYEVDDFAVHADQAWATEGRALLAALSEFGPLTGPCWETSPQRWQCELSVFFEGQLAQAV